MEAKVKEEIPDKDYTQPTSTERRKLSTASKERRSPEQDEGRAPSPSTGTAPAPPSPHHNGTAPASSEPGSPPAAERLPLPRLRRFLSALHHFAADAGADAGDRVRALVHSLVAGAIGVEEFQCAVAECTNYPLRASVPAFLRALLPPAQRDLAQRARRAKLTTLQYVRAHEHLVLDATDPELCTQAPDAAKRRAPDPYFDGQTNGAHDEPPPKRPPLLFPSPFACPLPAASNALFDYSHYNPYQGLHGEGFERRDGGISVRDVSSMNAPYAEPRAPPPGPRGDDEWRSINTMLNCILSMVEKTKRALAILQQRGVEPPESSEIKRAASDIMAAAVRQTEERVAEVRRRAEDAVNQVKRQALAELQRAVSAAESKALEGAKAEPGAAPPPPPARELSPNAAQQNCCWNCGRKAQETCSGCNAARYCGAFCQHKDWENHHQVCTGRDQKPTALLRTSPPASTTKPRAPTPSATNPAPTNERLAERLLTNPERILTSSERLLTNERLSSGSERLSLATLTTAQGLIGLGKK